jgi:hypothetical protein
VLKVFITQSINQIKSMVEKNPSAQGTWEKTTWGAEAPHPHPHLIKAWVGASGNP